MPGVKPRRMKSSNKIKDQLVAYDAQRRALVGRLADLGYIWHGSLVHRMLTCGKADCPCKDDLQARHGPYDYWTTKIAGKTVSRILAPPEASLYEEWIRNRRGLEDVLVELKKLSTKVAPLLLQIRGQPGK